MNKSLQNCKSTVKLSYCSTTPLSLILRDTVIASYIKKQIKKNKRKGQNDIHDKITSKQKETKYNIKQYYTVHMIWVSTKINLQAEWLDAD